MFSSRRCGLGRRASIVARLSALIARYVSRPPLRRISRDTVDGERPKPTAIAAADCPAAIPREISSRSADDRCRSLRFEGATRIPPDCKRNRRTVCTWQPRLRAIKRSESRRRHCSQI